MLKVGIILYYLFSRQLGSINLRERPSITFKYYWRSTQIGFYFLSILGKGIFILQCTQTDSYICFHPNNYVNNLVCKLFLFHDYNILILVSFPSQIKRLPRIHSKYFNHLQHDFDEFTINPHVHKHMELLKSSTQLVNYQQLPRNQSSKFDRQRDLIEKIISARPVQSQYVRKSNILPDNKRPKTPNYNQQEPHLGEYWRDLAQKVVVQANTVVMQQSLHESEKSLTYL